MWHQNMENHRENWQKSLQIFWEYVLAGIKVVYCPWSWFFAITGDLSCVSEGHRSWNLHPVGTSDDSCWRAALRSTKLINMHEAHKALAARWSAIRALDQSPFRMLYTIATTSYQITVQLSGITSIKALTPVLTKTDYLWSLRTSSMECIDSSCFHRRFYNDVFEKTKGFQNRVAPWEWDCAIHRL